MHGFDVVAGFSGASHGGVGQRSRVSVPPGASQNRQYFHCVLFLVLRVSIADEQKRFGNR
ncbi:hypothetical protein LO772_35635 [Yinghuangia sp. ASG 101]|uniref:hypothetical protein n=1 Tax=Yinghuangia sp. ASG 101 TaxID=2896848 RepID=UPI001E5FC196|nr:hypothetical protein [Yinghuangia sp. ASG 101]UGQ15710.1 hypothetical protein LO772_35635 [Yinghuangia sp. ASG 101]